MFLIEAIRNKLIINNQTFYEVKWAGYPENLNTFELGNNLPLTKIEEFEKTIDKRLNKNNHTKNYRPLRKCRKNVIIIDDENNQEIKKKNENSDEKYKINFEIIPKDNETKASSKDNASYKKTDQKNQNKEENIKINEKKNLLDLKNKNKKQIENLNNYDSHKIQRPLIKKTERKFIFRTHQNLLPLHPKGEINKVKKIIIHKQGAILVQIGFKKKCGYFSNNSLQKIEKILDEAPDKLGFFLLNIFKEEIQKNCFSENY